MIGQNGYSRLSWSEERRLRRRTFFLGFLSTILLIGFLIWGVPTISNIIATVRGFRPSNLAQTKSDSLPPPQPLVFPLSVATNSANISVSGSTEAETNIEIAVNGKLQATTTSDKDGFFKSLKIALTEGQNTIQVTAVDKAGNRSQPSQPVTTTFDKTKLSISVDQPQDNQKFTGIRQQRPTVSGKINKPAALTINQRFIYVATDGSFSTTLNLSAGDNSIVAIATDSAGNYDTKQLKVVFEP